MMKHIALLGGLVIGLAVASEARSQQPATKEQTQRPATQATDSVSLKLSPDLQKSLDNLAAAVQALAIRVATDPALKAAAFQVASGAVTTARQVVAEQSVVIEGALKTAAERISTAAQSTQRQPVTKP